MSSKTADRLRDGAMAIWFTGPRRAEVLPDPAPPPGRGEVTVKALTSMISTGTELRYFRGEVDLTADIGLPTMTAGATYPVKFGYECVGEVVDVGEGSELSVGQLVFARHPHQDVFTAPVRHGNRAIVVPLPSDLDPEAAVFLNLAEVALEAVLDVPPIFGDVVVIFGQGIVGLLLLQLVRRTAQVVAVVDPLPSRRALALSLGADLALEPAADVLSAVATGVGADVSYEVSGNTAALQQAIRCTRREGTVVVGSFFGDRPVELVLTPEFHVGRQTIVSTMVGGVSPRLGGRWDFDRRTRTALALLPSLHTQELLSHRFPFESAVEAFELLDQRKHEALGVALTYGGR